jgi:hypothetical protein
VPHQNLSSIVCLPSSGNKQSSSELIAAAHAGLGGIVPTGSMIALTALVSWTDTPTTRKRATHKKRGFGVEARNRLVGRTRQPGPVIFLRRATDFPHDRQLRSQLPGVLPAGAVCSPAGLIDGGSRGMTWSAA